VTSLKKRTGPNRRYVTARRPVPIKKNLPHPWLAADDAEKTLTPPQQMLLKNALIP
jgi:hypothetical protein